MELMTDRVKWCIFIGFCQVAQMFMSYDGGATPACIGDIQKSMDWTQAELGLLGSLDKIGMLISSVFWGRVLQIVPAKWLLVAGFSVDAIFCFAFGTIKSKYVMYGAKLVMGIAQGMKIVWSTCWTLAHAPADYRTTWLGCGAIAAGLGNGIGTIVAGFGTSQGLPYSFAWEVEAVCLALLWLSVMMLPSWSLAIEEVDEDASISEDEGDDTTRRMSAYSAISEVGPLPTQGKMRKTTLKHVGITDDGDSTDRSSVMSVGRRKILSYDFTDSSFMSRASSFDDAIIIARFEARERSKSEWSRRYSFDAPEENEHPMHRRKSAVSFQAEHYGEATTCETRTKTTFVLDTPALVVEKDTFEQIRELVRNPLYIRTALALASVMFCTSGIQFLWVRVFMDVWGLGKAFVISGFLTCNVGGAVGVIFGPRIIDRYGGFKTNHGKTKSLTFIVTMTVCIIFAAAASIAMLLYKTSTLGPEGAPQKGQPDCYLYSVWLALVVVFSSFNAILPGLTGINISAVDPGMWSLGSGLTVTLQNLFGFAMGPLLPGILMDHLAINLGWDMEDRLGAARLMSCGFLFVLLGTVVVFGYACASLTAAQTLPPGSDDEACGDGYEPLTGAAH